MSDLSAFKFEGGPIDAPSEAGEAFSVIGHAAASWARLELLIDIILIHVNNAEFSSTIYEEVHPVSFSKKVRLLKRWFNQHPALTNHKEDIRELTSRLKVLSNDRGLYIHSQVEAYDTTTKTVTLRNLQYLGNDEFSISRHEVAITSIAIFCDLVNATNKYMWREVALKIFTPDVVKQLGAPSTPSQEN